MKKHIIKGNENLFQIGNTLKDKEKGNKKYIVTKNYDLRDYDFKKFTFYKLLVENFIYGKALLIEKRCIPDNNSSTLLKMINKK